MSRTDRIERDFGLLEAAAVAGERCPFSNPFGPISSASITALVESGRIRSEVYRHNWRVVTILDGPHKGKSTQAAAPGLAPYLVNGGHVGRLRRREAKG